MILSFCLNPSIDTFLWLDRFEPKGTHRVGREQRFPGGKGVHVALAVSELGFASELMGVWGGESGAWIKVQCEGAGVRCHGPKVHEWSRSCFTIKSNDDFDDTEILGQGPELSSADWQSILTETKTLGPMASIICISGSLPRGLSDSAYAELIRITERPALVDCTGPSLQKALEAKPWGIHLNRSESAQLGYGDPVNAVKALSNRVALVAITAGREGLFLGFEGQIWHAQVQLSRIESAVGSGDCLVAGLAVAVSQRRGGEELARWGVACGAANCLRPELGMLNRKDVESLLPQIQIRRVKEA